MPGLVDAISVVRGSTVAILRVHLVRPEVVKKGKTLPAEVKCFFGSGFCIAENRLVATAHHVLSGGTTRNPKDRFYVLTVPENGDPAFHYPVTGFPLEVPELDFAVVELGPCSSPNIQLPALPVTYEPLRDGTPVVTIGYPSPEIGGINVDKDLNYFGGQFFLKSHANEGIVAAQYQLAGTPIYELNVGWHHGESGGPIATTDTKPAVFSLMQHYRNVQSPHGVVAGPHRGIALSVVRDRLEDLGVNASV